MKTLRASLVTLNAARDSFDGFDMEHQQSFVERATKATTREEIDAIKAELAEYRKKREHVFGALLAAYSALSLAATLEDGSSLAAAIAAVTALGKAVAELKGVP